MRPDPHLTNRRIVTLVEGIGWCSLPIYNEEEWKEALDE